MFHIFSSSLDVADNQCLIIVYGIAVTLWLNGGAVQQAHRGIQDMALLCHYPAIY